MPPAFHSAEDLGEARWISYFRNHLSQYVGPVVLGAWLVIMAGAVVFAPDAIMNLNFIALGIAFATATILFPGTVLVLAIFTLLLSPENFLVANKWVAAHVPTMEVQSVHKFLIIGAVIPPFVRFGIRPVMNYGLAALVLMLMMSLTVSTPFPGLTFLQMIKSFIGLGLPFVFFNMRLQRKWVDGHLTFLAVFPILSVILGAIAAELHFKADDGMNSTIWMHEFTGAVRLGGLNIPAYLAFFAYISFFICLYKAIALGKKGFYLLGGISLIILVITGTRTPSFCAIIIAAIGILFASGRDLRGSSKFVITVLGLAFLAAVLAAYWPELQQRMAENAGDHGNGINMSGRAGVWDYLFKIYDVNQLFGRGLGTGAIALLSAEYLNSITAAHNEYIRLLVDDGIVGMCVYILGVTALLIQEGRYLTRTQGVFVIALFVSFAIYSFTDNTISSPPSIVMFYAIALIMAKARYERMDALSAAKARA